MTNFYRILSALLLIPFASSVSDAQAWCTPNTATPYSPDMPGITRFALNTIDRTSSDLENYPDVSYVNTGLSTTLVVGRTYTVTMSFTVDEFISPDMNLRVWIDYNQDGKLDGVGETVISANDQQPGTFSGTFTVSDKAKNGTTRLRATAKMTSKGGHTLPTPCDVPPDPLGYHGELEDYNVTIESSAGVDDRESIASSVEAVPNVGTANEISIRYALANGGAVKVLLHDVVGNRIATLEDVGDQTAGEHTLALGSKVRELPAGVYFAALIAGDQRRALRVVVAK